MRIIGGKHKGRKLHYHQRPGLRPTTGRVKEALFNILGPALVNSSFLDLFAGCGSVGLEAVSRGAEPVVLVEKDGQSCQAIHRNLRLITEKAMVLNLSFELALKKLAAENLSFAYIFLDPGYHSGLAESCLQALSKNSIINDNTLIIAEHPARLVLPESFGQLVAVRRLVYGGSGLAFYQPGQAEE